MEQGAAGVNKGKQGENTDVCGNEGLNIISEIDVNLENSVTSKRRRVSTTRSSSQNSKIISRSNRSTANISKVACTEKVNVCGKTKCGPCYICEKNHQIQYIGLI